MLRQSVLGSFFALALVSTQANAAPVSINPFLDQTSAGLGVAAVLTDGSQYKSGPLDPPALNDDSPFEHYYKFVVSPSDVTASTVLQIDYVPPMLNAGISELSFQWLDSAFAAVGSAIQVTNADGTLFAGSTNPYLLVQNLTAPLVYYLYVEGTTIGSGRYDFDLLAAASVDPPVPLPGALVLFGSVLVGGIGFMHRRRAKA